MNRLKTDKLNPLLLHWKPGTLLTSKYLNERGYYKQLLSSYCKKGWLKSVGQGCFSRLNDEITWFASVAALQSQLKLPVHAGGLTALSVHGIFHYVTLTEKNPAFSLYNTIPTKVSLPAWFKHYFLNAQLEQKKLFNDDVGLSMEAVSGISISVSSPERAMMEVLALVPNKFTLLHASELMEGLDRLRPKMVQRLLEECLSIKVKRLFLYLSEKYNLPFFDDLDLNKINLGSGKRVIGEGANYSAKWQLSLPRLNDMNDDSEIYNG